MVIFVKEAFTRQPVLTGFDVHFWRGFMMIPATWVVCQFVKVNIFSIKRHEIAPLVLRCSFGVLGALFHFWGYHYISAGKGMLLFNLGPLIQVLFGWVILGE